jgi:hypothetical protein
MYFCYIVIKKYNNIILYYIIKSYKNKYFKIFSLRERETFF